MLHRVGGRQVVVLAGVDDDPAARVELPREVLVDERALHVDVAEQDPVHRVVEQHVEPLERRGRGDLRHAQPAGVVGEHHVAPEPLRSLVERGAHDAKVLLRRVRSAEAFGRRAVRHVVDQRLRGRADHRDDLRAGLRGGDGGGAVLVDVAAGDDHVQQRRLAQRQPREQRLARAAVRVDPRQAGRGVRGERGAQRRLRRAGGVGERLAGRDGLGDLPRRPAGLRKRRAESARGAELAPRQPVDDPVRQRDAVRVHAVDPAQAQDGALDADGRVARDETFGRAGDRAGQPARPRDGLLVETQSHSAASVFRIGRGRSAAETFGRRDEPH